MLSSLRQTLRRLTREAGFTTTVLLTLALCIGANVAIYAVVDAILVRPLPFREADRLVTLYNSYPNAGMAHSGASATNYYERRHALPAFASLAIIRDESKIVGAEGSPTRVPIARVSPEFFQTLGVPLALGRAFTDAEMTYATDMVAILTDGYWRAHFHADAAVLGQTFINDGLTVTVVGVLPPGFTYLSNPAQFFRPASHGPNDIQPDNRHNNEHQMIARLAPGVSLAAAQAQLDAFNLEQLKDDPRADLARGTGYSTIVADLHADTVQGIRPTLLLLQAGVAALLLIGGSNLVNLLLIRAQGRAKEFAVRQALGAGHRHLIREVLAETLVLALTGGVLGLLLGAFGVDLLARLGADRLPLGHAIALDGRVALVALVASLAVGVGVAVPVILLNFHRQLRATLQSESGTTTVGRAAQRVRHGFIVAQISLAFVLLSGAGLLGVSLKKILAASPGFQTDHILTAQLTLPWRIYVEPSDRLAFFERLEAALRTQPGLTAVALSSGVPFSGRTTDSAVLIEGVPPAPGASIRTHYSMFALGDYWRALGIPLLAGRFLEDADNHRPQRVCVVDQEFVRRYWPEELASQGPQVALGRRISGDPKLTPETAITIVGVVGNVKQRDLADAQPLGAVYYRFNERPFNTATIVLRTTAAPEAMAATIRQTVLSLDPSLPVEDIRTLEARLDDSLATRRSPALLAAAFAVTALLLAAVGTYGVLAYAVNQRRREIGVRMALGALPPQILTHFMKFGARLLALGVLLGLAGAWVAGRAMQSVLFGVDPVDISVLAITLLTLGAVVLLAIFIPSRRATKLNPLVALRTE